LIVSSTYNPKRGEVLRVRFDPTEDSEQAGERPALVLSPDYINERAPIILVAPFTTRKTERVYAFEALIQPPEGGLTQRSKIMLLHVRGIDKARITGNFGTLSAETMERVEEALRVATGLTTV
jgi:mRNA interferase MazF